MKTVTSLRGSKVGRSAIWSGRSIPYHIPQEEVRRDVL